MNWSIKSTRTAQQHVVLAGALLHAGQQLVVLLHQRVDQRTIGLGQQRCDRSDPGVVRQAEGSGQLALALFPLAARGLDDVALGIDRRDGFQQFVGLAANDVFLLRVEQGEQFAVVLEFFAQAFDEILQEFTHGCKGFKRAVVAAGRVDAVVLTAPVWCCSSPARLLASPKLPDLEMLSASWLTTRSR